MKARLGKGLDAGLNRLAIADQDLRHTLVFHASPAFELPKHSADRA